MLYNLIIFPGFLFTAVAGSLGSWVDRKLTARFQMRVGPPWYQPFADIIKLLGKEVIIPEGASRWVFLVSPMVGLAGATLAASVIWGANMEGSLSFVGDLIVVLYLLGLPSLAIIMAGFSSNSAYATLGASREMKLILSYELPFVVAVFTVVLKAGTIILSGILQSQVSGGMMIAHPSCIIAFIVCLLSAMAKLSLTPFDIPDAEQEIAGGPLVEYSGALLAIFKITKAMLYLVLPLFLITLFFGGAALTSMSGAVAFAVKYFIVLLLVSVVKNTNPRLRIDQAIRFFWGPMTALAAAGFILAILGV